MINDDRLPLKLRFLEYFKELPVQKLAGGYIGRDEDTISRWKAEDSDFAEQILLAKSTWALAKTKKIKSEEWLLERVIKDHFSPRQEVTGADGEAIEVTLDKLETDYEKFARETKKQMVENEPPIQDKG